LNITTIRELGTYRCPKCNGATLSTDCAQTDHTQHKVVIQCRECQATYPVRNGIPRFVNSDQYAESFGFQWNRFRSTQLDSHTGKPLTETRLFHVTEWPRDMRGLRLLEVGSGAGRFTEVLLRTGATVFSFDLSNAVDANFASNGNAENLNLFQASIYEIPLPEQHFDRVMCLGVLQHTPDPDRSFATLARYVKPGGELAVDVYSRRWRSLVSWKYLLRPITKRLPQQTLFRLVEIAIAVLLRPTMLLRKVGGKFGARLLPIVEYSHLGLPDELNREWATLDTFDMYSPAHDHPRSIHQVREWFAKAGFIDVVVEYGPNGVIGRGTRPAAVPPAVASAASP